MALISASLDFTFNANYTGCHRICWRVQGGPPAYDCTTQVNCAGNALPCTATVSIIVDDADCVPVTYEGYVQACCEDILSTNGRVAFSVTLNPTTNCLGYTITCNGPFSIAFVSATSAGSGYVPAAVIPVVFNPALGGVAANAIIGDGGVSSQFGSATPFPFGAGYVDGTYNNVPAVTLTGVGLGALFTVVVTGGQVTSTEIVPGSNGTGYLAGDTVTFNNANLGGSGAGVVVTISVVNTGEVQNIIITNPGAGYTTVVPTATIPGGIVPAVLQAALSGCPTIDLNVCNDPGFYNIFEVPANTSFVNCNTAVPVLPVEYSAVQNTCCNSCTTITFDKPASYTNPPATIYYQDCVTKIRQQVNIVAGGSYGPVCAIDNSWFVVESDPINGSTSISQSGPC